MVLWYQMYLTYVLKHNNINNAHHMFRFSYIFFFNPWALKPCYIHSYCRAVNYFCTTHATFPPDATHKVRRCHVVFKSIRWHTLVYVESKLRVFLLHLCAYDVDYFLGNVCASGTLWCKENDHWWHFVYPPENENGDFILPSHHIQLLHGTTFTDKRENELSTGLRKFITKLLGPLSSVLKWISPPMTCLFAANF